MHPMPQRRRRVQADDARRVGAPPLRDLDPRDEGRERGVHGADHGGGEDLEAAVEAGMLSWLSLCFSNL